MELDTPTIGAQPCRVKSRVCMKCGEEKPLEAFSLKSDCKHGRASRCKVCVSEYAKQRYKAKREHILATGQRWREANRERHREMKRSWSRKNLERRREMDRKWSKANKEKKRESVRQARRRNPVANRARVAAYRAVKDGRLKRPPYCQHCYKPCKPDAHHYDYSKPLDVWWLCHLCHGNVHRLYP